MLRIETFIEPFLRESHGKPPTHKHIVVVAHGIFNSEFVGALLARTHVKPLEWGYKGMFYKVIKLTQKE